MEPAPPSIVLHVEHKELLGAPGRPGVCCGKIHLTAEVTDPDLFDTIVERVNGIPIYSSNTLTESLIEAAARKAERAEKKLSGVEEGARTRIEQLEATLAFKEVELVKAKERLAQYDAWHAELKARGFI